MCLFWFFCRGGLAVFVLVFFFSSRRRHTRWNCDWSSDVCSSDLLAACTLGLGASLRAVLEAMTRSGKQIVLVLDADRRLAGAVTDGDIRRASLRGASLDAKV